MFWGAVNQRQISGAPGGKKKTEEVVAEKVVLL